MRWGNFHYFHRPQSTAVNGGLFLASIDDDALRSFDHAMRAFANIARNWPQWSVGVGLTSVAAPAGEAAVPDPAPSGAPDRSGPAAVSMTSAEQIPAAVSDPAVAVTAASEPISASAAAVARDPVVSVAVPLFSEPIAPLAESVRHAFLDVTQHTLFGGPDVATILPAPAESQPLSLIIG